MNATTTRAPRLAALLAHDVLPGRVRPVVVWCSHTLVQGDRATFAGWLARQLGRDDPSGWLALVLDHDTAWPPRRQSRGQLLGWAHRRYPAAGRNALEVAWSEWNACGRWVPA